MNSYLYILFLLTLFHTHLSSCYGAEVCETELCGEGDESDSWWESPDRRSPTEMVDQEISKCTLLINMGKHQEAISILTNVIHAHPDFFQPYVARGSAYALEQEFERALSDMTKAIDLNPSYVDSWVRRSQIRSAMGDTTGSMEDLKQAKFLSKGGRASVPADAMLSIEYGQYEFNRNNFTGAVSILKGALALSDGDSKVTNLVKYHLAKTYLELGEIFKARSTLSAVLKSDPELVPALSEMGQVMKEFNSFREADKLFTSALDLLSKDAGASQPQMLLLTHLRIARLRHWAGELVLTVECASAGIDAHSEGTLLEMAYYLGGSYHGLGAFQSAIEAYARGLSYAPTHFIYYLSEVSKQHHIYFDTPLNEYNWDFLFSPQFKECYAMRRDTKECLPKRYVPLSSPGDSIPSLDLNRPLSPSQAQLLALARSYGAKILYNSPGFVTNRKQILSSGCAMIETAQVLRRIIKGETVSVSGQASSLNREPHAFGWRDFFDILVRWRQAVEPLDPVWWIDRLTPESFQRGYGTTTPLIIGDKKNIRYFPYFNSVFNLLKFLLPLQEKLTDEQVYRVITASSLHEVYSVIGSEISVLSPCFSASSPGAVMDGSRIKLYHSREEHGYMLEISTSAVGPRWKQFDLELQSVFQNITFQGPGVVTRGDALRLSLTLAYYWFQFMPLSRGSAAIGVQTISSVLLAFGYEYRGAIPRGVQIDWEAMVRSRPGEFIESLASWLKPDSLEEIGFDILEDVPGVEQNIVSLRDMFSIVNSGMVLD